VEPCRHGARASSHIFPLTKNAPFDNFKEPSQLTRTGAEEHFLMGSKFIRPRFIEEKGFLSIEYDPSEVYV